jgi:hypothetical protein
MVFCRPAFAKRLANAFRSRSMVLACITDSCANNAPFSRVAHLKLHEQTYWIS